MLFIVALRSYEVRTFQLMNRPCWKEKPKDDKPHNSNRLFYNRFHFLLRPSLSKNLKESQNIMKHPLPVIELKP